MVAVWVVPILVLSVWVVPVWVVPILVLSVLVVPVSVLYQRHCAQSFHVLDKFIEVIVGKAHAGCSGEDGFRRWWGFSPANGLLAGVAGFGDMLSSCERMLAGAGAGCGGCPPTNESSSEVAISFARLLRRRQVSSVVGLSSGERVSRRRWGSGNLISSCGRLLAGAGRGCGSCPPTNEGSAEVASSYARLLRRGHPLREVVPSSSERPSHRSWASGNLISSCGRMLAGAGGGCGGCPPTNESSSEVALSFARLLRRRQTLSEVVPSSGERTLIGADAPIQPSAPAKPAQPKEKRHPHPDAALIITPSLPHS